MVESISSAASLPAIISYFKSVAVNHHYHPVGLASANILAIGANLLPSFSNFGWLAYWLVFFAAFFESFPFIGLLMPGTIILIAVGFLVSLGYFNFYDMVIAAVIGSFFGDALSYYLGGRFGRKIFSDTAKFFHNKYLAYAENYFKNHGGKSVFWGRFLGPVRPFISFVAGVGRMDWRRFQIFNAISAVLFGIIFISAGFIFGDSWQFLALWIDRLGLMIISILALVAVYLYLWRVIGKNRRAIQSFFKSLFSSFSLAIKENIYYKKFIKSHPRFINFVRRRLSAEEYLGIHFTAGLVIGALFLWGFLGVVEDLISKDALYLADLRVVNLAASFRTPFLDRLMLFITDFGEWQMITVLSLIIAIILLRRKKISQLLSLVAGLAGGSVLFSLTKIISHRQRPPIIDRLYSIGGYSFPSGHSVMSVVIYGFLAYLIIKAVKNWKAKAAIFLGGIFFVGLIGFSRVYLGVHYPSDVLGGWLLGLFWLTVIITALEIQLKYFSLKNPPALITSKKFFNASVAALILFFVVFSVVFYKVREPLLLFGESKNSQITPAPLPEDIFGVLPKSSETLTGSPMEPISLVFVGSQAQINKVFGAAGWLKADPITFGSVLKITVAALFQTSYSRAPMTPSFFNYFPDDFGFEKQVGSILDRHHLRLWKTNFTYNGENIWVSTASFDEGLKYLITHHINPDIDKERDFVLAGLLQTGLVEDYREIQLVPPEQGQNQAGDAFFTDGKAYIIFLRNKSQSLTAKL